MINNNLPPASQQWVRDIESRLTSLESASKVSAETNRQQNVTLGGLSQTVGAVVEQQDLLSINTSSDIIQLPAVSTVTSASVLTPVNLTPKLTGHSGLVTFTISPVAALGGAAGGMFVGQVYMEVRFTGGLAPLILSHYIDGDSTRIPSQDVSTTMDVARAMLISEIYSVVEVFEISENIAVTLSGFVATTYNVQKV